MVTIFLVPWGEKTDSDVAEQTEPVSREEVRESWNQFWKRMEATLEKAIRRSR